MNASEQSLYDRISRFSFDDGDEELTFAGRLARENGWTPNYTARVIEEYKRFIFLAVVSRHPVTPSDQVDQVWHLHLTYTRSYWDRLCGQVLGRPLHHGPTRGGGAEAQKFDRWYTNTLESYTRLFGDEPPNDIWPHASVRFGADCYFQRTNTKRNWIIHKPQATAAARKVGLALLLMFVVLASALSIQPLLGQAAPGRTFAKFVDSQSFEATAAERAGAILREGDTIWVVIIVVVMVFLCILSLIVRQRCPVCKRYRGLEKTGAMKKGGWLKAGWVERKCKYCGYRQWQKRPPRWYGGWGGGCGAFGGCGGCGGGCGGCGG